jgi:putative salt-induced outer membrane protein YdiY
MSRKQLPLVLVLVVLGAGAPVLARQKTDIVFLNNGDRVTGEIKQLDRGILQLSTNDIGTINIEWEDVDSLSSVYQFRVEDHYGIKYFGAIFLTRAGSLQVIQNERVEESSQDDVVAITPLEESFWQQLDGAVSVGFSYTKSNSLGQLTADANVRRRTLIRLFELDMSSIMTSQEDEHTQRRDDLSLTYNRLFEGPLFFTASAATQRNDELGLDRRASFSGGGGAKLMQSHNTDLVVATGLSVNREWSDFSEGGTNLEAFLSSQLSVFRYDYPKTDITTEVTIYPSLTDWGRLRAEIDISASREVVSDFTVVLSFYDSYDSDPLDPAATKNDYGLVFSLGWTF